MHISPIHTLTRPSPPHRAALLLEDAYQYLQWYLATKPHLNHAQHAQGRTPLPPQRPPGTAAPPSAKKRPKKQQPSGESKAEGEGEETEEEDVDVDVDAGGVLLTVQVDGIDGDQLVQFRSLQVRCLSPWRGVVLCWGGGYYESTVNQPTESNQPTGHLGGAQDVGGRPLALLAPARAARRRALPRARYVR